MSLYRSIFQRRVSTLVLLALVGALSSAAPKSTREDSEVYSLDNCGGLDNIMKGFNTQFTRYQIALVHKQHKETCLHWHQVCPNSSQAQLHESESGSTSPTCIEGLMWCLKRIMHLSSTPCCTAVHGACQDETGLFLIEASHATDSSSQCQSDGLARRPPKECFEEVSIDYSCTGVLDEGSAAICVGDQTPDAQIGAWIATAVLATTVIALVVIGAVVTVRIMKHYRCLHRRDYLPIGQARLAAVVQPPAGVVQPPAGVVQPPAAVVQPPAAVVQPPPAAMVPAAIETDGSAQSDEGTGNTTVTDELGTTPELISDLGDGVLVWFNTPQNPSSVLEPNLTAKTSSDSEGPKSSNSSESQPTSMESGDDRQAGLDPGEDDHEESPLVVSTLAPLSSNGPPKRQRKGSKPGTQSPYSSSDADTEDPKHTRPSKQKSSNHDIDPAGLADTMSPDTSPIEGSTEVQPNEHTS